MSIPIHESTATVDLAELVGCPCRVTRAGACRGHGTLSTPHLSGSLLRCQTGSSMWLAIGSTNWIRTSPVIATVTTSTDDEIQLVVITRDARYQLEFDRPTPQAHAVGQSQESTR